MKIVPSKEYVAQIISELKGLVQHLNFGAIQIQNDETLTIIINKIYEDAQKEIINVVKNCHHNCDSDNSGCDLTSNYCLANEHCPKEIW